MGWFQYFLMFKYDSGRQKRGEFDGAVRFGLTLLFRVVLLTFVVGGTRDPDQTDPPCPPYNQARPGSQRQGRTSKNNPKKNNYYTEEPHI